MGFKPEELTTPISQDYTYDAYGNLTAFYNDPAKGPGELPNVNVDPSTTTNRLKSANGYSYDAAGNTLTTGGGHSYTWDGVNMMTTQSTPGLDYSFLYTADDERIAKFAINGQGGVNEVTWTVRGLDNKVLRTYESTGGTWGTDTLTWKKDHVYRGGQLLATVEDPDTGNGTLEQETRHFHLDHLGTPRLITDASGEKVSLHTYYPFGAEATEVTQDDESMKFTGHERDTLADPDDANVLDYMHARYYGVGVGRFVSVDWAMKIKKTAIDPQRWNRYAYVMNRPIVNLDPDGRVAVGFTGWTGQRPGSAINDIDRALVNAGTLGATRVFASNDVDDAYDFVTAELKADPSQPVVIYGHSYGGDSSIRLAERLDQAGVTVNFLGLIDPVGKWGKSMQSPLKIPKNVAFAVNYIQRRERLGGTSIARTSPFTSGVQYTVVTAWHGQTDEAIRDHIINLILSGKLDKARRLLK